MGDPRKAYDSRHRGGQAGQGYPCVLITNKDGDVIDISESDRASDGEQSSRELLRTRCI